MYGCLSGSVFVCICASVVFFFCPRKRRDLGWFFFVLFSLESLPAELLPLACVVVHRLPFVNCCRTLTQEHVHTLSLPPIAHTRTHTQTNHLLAGRITLVPASVRACVEGRGEEGREKGFEGFFVRLSSSLHRPNTTRYGSQEINEK